MLTQSARWPWPKGAVDWGWEPLNLANWEMARHDET